MANLVKIGHVFLNLDLVRSIEDLFTGTREDKVVVPPICAAARSGVALVTISTAISPEGPRNRAPSRPSDRSGRPDGCQPSWPASQAASQIARRGVASPAGAGTLASIRTESILAS